MKLMPAVDSAAFQNDILSDSAGELARIGEMAKQFGVTLRTLRFYEDKGLISPLREGATRLYTHRDKARLKLILLGRKVGFSLRDVKLLMDLYDPSGTNIKQLKVALDKSDKQLARLQNQRALLDEAINVLSHSMADIRRTLAERSSVPSSVAN
ncbi:transcriptional regulator [Mesorhizobium sp. Root157]|uniref:MerR family transcriptional regulator n=1 Tax=Mesorhizobium sp. Root157 TaxID=1736477 RepID=UPI0006FAD2EB|nr:MerR family DNA-binding transcriptional regulator [Mesorhizobium sp. Root157]KQZ82993.1 transcriptional regulator [Mesorhizobium sp. Root157]